MTHFAMIELFCPGPSQAIRCIVGELQSSSNATEEFSRFPRVRIE